MSFLAANPADFSHLSSCPMEQANKSLSTRNYGSELRPSYGGHSRSNRTAIAVNFRSQCADENFALACVCRYVSVFCSVTASGPFRRPAALGLLLRIARPFRDLGSSQNKFENHGKERLSNFFRAPPRKQTFGTWEPGPLAKLRPV
jgi:hypothetical protein